MYYSDCVRADDGMVIEGLKKLSLNELFTRLHESVSNLAKNIGQITDRNREMSLVDIIELRNHIKRKLDAKQEVAENEKVLKLIELFKENKNAMELIKTDMEEWLAFLEAIKFHLEHVKDLGEDESKELQKIKKEITQLQVVLRK